MLETVIVGGGLCGLSLAVALQAQGRSFALYEARPRLGGRVLSVPSEKAGMRLDLGPTWYWPDTQPGMTKLVADLGLITFPQNDSGSVLRLHDHDKKAVPTEVESVHGGARRVEGGMASVIEALAAKIPADTIHLGQALTVVIDRGDHVELHFRVGETVNIIEARRVVLALPPRIVEEHVRFEPSLDENLVAAMQDTYTWMAGEAKGVIAYDKPGWREAGQSGNAFVTHEQAVFGEIFDACDATGTRAALGGFLALAPALRASFKAGLPMLMGNQMGQVFGPEYEHGEQHYQDWAAEEFTATRHDQIRPDDHPHYGNPFLRQVLWDGKLFLGGSETATYAGGYMEGALDSARRLARDVGRFAPTVVVPLQPGKEGISNVESVAQFAQWVAGRQNSVLETYRLTLNKLMASPDKEIVTQRAMVATVEQVFSEALFQLEQIPFDMQGVMVEKGRSDLTPQILKSFDGFIQFLLDAVIQYNRTSCALSNFPGEDKPSKDYLQAILRDIAAAWKEFCLSVNAYFVSKTPVLAAS
ncbi:flavin monoamine oxidase family protein [Beijerinckia indica]|uniref:Amine oxidase n=1 Tax=Beijerinckia indica subsp. indica (strain ATCC 9039 / DSM 1715 / NCIMB 8712) TaxID=395963 RepID=B2IG57_BEII9|nr:NAD(P)/FAD-dependent oxidoreductase [Beijerinckia indica]ACB97131.1 amine oxidase [Beijerinckia indica subsp. indica ATCC 9039]